MLPGRVRAQRGAVPPWWAQEPARREQPGPDARARRPVERVRRPVERVRRHGARGRRPRGPRRPHRRPSRRVRARRRRRGLRRSVLHRWTPTRAERPGRG
ncbi:hypothetical protein Csp2054_02560 [Curtobacterium sp. 'Ferrero']|nr:hypothetical protein Csp2054_02560 [Curtobacterium sp. 'Ferrero']